jgi:hypothetical protein
MTLDGRAPKTGEIWRNPNLAALLERIGRTGARRSTKATSRARSRRTCASKADS